MLCFLGYLCHSTKSRTIDLFKKYFKIFYDDRYDCYKICIPDIINFFIIPLFLAIISIYIIDVSDVLDSYFLLFDLIVLSLMLLCSLLILKSANEFIQLNGPIDKEKYAMVVKEILLVFKINSVLSLYSIIFIIFKKVFSTYELILFLNLLVMYFTLIIIKNLFMIIKRLNRLMY